MAEIKRLANPFVVGRYAGAEYFCDRVEETAMLQKQIDNGRDVALISPRRMGKTGLITHLFSKDEFSKDNMCFFVDILSTSCLAEMAYLLGKSIFDRLKSRPRRWLERFIAVAESLRGGFSIDPLSGEPSFQLAIGDLARPEVTLDEIFRYLDSAPQPCVVAIEEFQQIGQYPEKGVEALLRTHIQRCSNARFIFAGSQQHVMANMFVDSARPFYQSAVFMHLSPIPLEIYEEFAKNKFRDYSKEITGETIALCYDFAHSNTWYVQLLLNELFATTGERTMATTENVEKAIRNLVALQAENFRLQLSRLTARQRELLIAIAREGEARAIMSARFIKAHSLGSPSIVQSSLRALVAQDLVTAGNAPSSYRLYDPLMAFFLNQTY